MGFFSWKTQDTDKSIANCYSVKDTFTVYLIDNKGNIWKESNYGGYGVFGGKDFFELVAEMNGYDKTDRDAGIDFYYSNKKGFYPNLVENIDNWKWKNERPLDCIEQGYFYDISEIFE